VSKGRLSRGFGGRLFKKSALIIFSLTSAVFAGQPQFAFTPPSPWQKGGISQVDSGWMLKNSPTKASLTVTTDSSDEAFDFKGLDEARLFQIVETTRALPLQIFGIRDWKVEKHRISPISNGTVIEMQGHYRATSGTPVRFIERDYFIGKNSYTVSFFEDDNGSPLQSETSIESLLDLFKAKEAQP
jgi:hypothetical protein